MTTLTVARRCAYYTGICASLILAMGTSHAEDCADVILVANDDPSPDDPAIAVVSGELININVLDNDDIVDDDLGDGHCFAAVTIKTPPVSGGSAVVLADFTVDYTPAPGFGGTDTFTYAITDINDVESEIATVTIMVDGSISLTKAGKNIVVFGGAAFPGGGAALSAAGEEATNDGESSTQCCTIRDPRVGAGNIKKDGLTAFDWVPFDIGTAMTSTELADEACFDMPQPAAGDLIVPRHFGVHTNPAVPNPVPADFRFGLCVVNTPVEWKGPVAVDVVATEVEGLGYAVDCENPASVDEQPLVLGLSMNPSEFTSPLMRAITSECDPRGVTRWSTWYFIVNAQHLTEKEDSKTYVSRMSSVLKNLIEAIRVAGAADQGFLNGIKELVLQAEELVKTKKSTPEQAEDAMVLLDTATVMALPDLEAVPPDPDPYVLGTSFVNPKGELVSHLAALRYAYCSELAFPGETAGNCKMTQAVVDALPTLP